MHGEPCRFSLTYMKRSLLPLIVLGAILAASFAIPATASAAARQGTLSVSVSGLPSKSKKATRSISVRAINVASGVVAEASFAKRANAAIKLDPGAWLLALRTIDFPGIASEGTSGLAIVKSGKKTRQKLRVKPLKKKKKQGAKKSARISAKKKSLWAPDSAYTGLRVIGVDPRLTLTGLDEYPKGLEIDSIVTVPLTQGCAGDSPKVRVVEIRRRAEIIEEIERGEDPRFDKSKAVKRGRLMKERELVQGSAVVADGKINVYLRLVDVKTGEVRAAGATIGDASTAAGIIDAVEAAGEALMDDLCSPKVDVTFSGSNSYQRDEGNSASDSEDHVSASYSWNTVYRGVSLGTDGALNFATSNSISGNWTTDGRYGAEGPGNYHCEAPIVGYAGDFSMLGVKRSVDGVELTIDPYFNVQGDYAATNCSGLGSPPFASFTALGHAPPNQAKVAFRVADLGDVPLTFNVGPTTPLAADCSDMVTEFEPPCSQSQSWSGSVSVVRAQE